MECEDNGYDFIEAATAVAKFGIKQKQRYDVESNLQLGLTTAVPCTSNRKQIHFSMVPPIKSNYNKHIAAYDAPFMSNMDEISYWVHTKRAPCLYNYDKTIAKLSEQPHSSKFKPNCNTVEQVPSPKKNKRKLVLCDEDSISMEQQQNVYFDTSQCQKQKPAQSDGKSSTMGSDVDFNIKVCSTQLKPKRMKLQKNRKITLAKNSKMVTSTPKATTLRRSLRRSRQNVNNNSQLESSYEVIDNSIMNGTLQSTQKPLEKEGKGETKNIKVIEQSSDKQNATLNEKSRNDTEINGQFEDVSDVSGFTANYIRSTKVNSKTPRNVRSKLTRKCIKESKQPCQQPESSQVDDTRTIMCVNKSMNTGLPDSAALNCSTDSSQNVINLVTLKSNENHTRISRATSLLKFIDPKDSNSKESLRNNDIDQSHNNLNSSFQSNGTSRYPKRQKNHTNAEKGNSSAVVNTRSRSTPNRRKKTTKNSSEFNNSDRKENPEEEFVSRTRSGRKIGLKVRQAENSVLVLSNSAEQVSSVTAVNVAGPAGNNLTDELPKKKQLRKSADGSRQSLKRLKDKSGFTACFSDSDNDSELNKEKKFFS